MTIYTKTVTGVEAIYTTPYLALLNWFCDQVEATRSPERRFDPIYCGASELEFLVMLVGMIERQFRTCPELDPDHSVEEQYLAILDHLHLYGDIEKLMVA